MWFINKHGLFPYVLVLDTIRQFHSSEIVAWRYMLHAVFYGHAWIDDWVFRHFVLGVNFCLYMLFYQYCWKHAWLELICILLEFREHFVFVHGWIWHVCVSLFDIFTQVRDSLYIICMELSRKWCLKTRHGNSVQKYLHVFAACWITDMWFTNIGSPDTANYYHPENTFYNVWRKSIVFSENSTRS
jgi:hypothetical protein